MKSDNHPIEPQVLFEAAGNGVQNAQEVLAEYNAITAAGHTAEIYCSRLGFSVIDRTAVELWAREQAQKK